MAWESVTSQDLSSLTTIFSGSTTLVLVYLVARINAVEKKLEAVAGKLLDHLIDAKKCTA